MKSAPLTVAKGAYVRPMMGGAVISPHHIIYVNMPIDNQFRWCYNGLKVFNKTYCSYSQPYTPLRPGDSSGGFFFNRKCSIKHIVHIASHSVWLCGQGMLLVYFPNPEYIPLSLYPERGPEPGVLQDRSIRFVHQALVACGQYLWAGA